MPIKKGDKLLGENLEASSCCDFSKKKKYLLVLVIVLVLLLGTYLLIFVSPVGAWLGVGVNKGSQEYQQKMYLKEVESLTKKIDRHLLLPTGEVPQLRTIEDAKAAAGAQTFFAGTVDGDKVLIYVNARKAVVYSPSRDLVVNVGPIFMDEESAPKEESQTATSTDKK